MAPPESRAHRRQQRSQADKPPGSPREAIARGPLMSCFGFLPWAPGETAEYAWGHDEAAPHAPRHTPPPPAAPSPTHPVPAPEPLGKREGNDARRRYRERRRAARRSGRHGTSCPCCGDAPNRHTSHSSPHTPTAQCSDSSHDSHNSSHHSSSHASHTGTAHAHAHDHIHCGHHNHTHGSHSHSHSHSHNHCTRSGDGRICRPPRAPARGEIQKPLQPSFHVGRARVLRAPIGCQDPAPTPPAGESNPAGGEILRQASIRPRGRDRGPACSDRAAGPRPRIMSQASAGWRCASGGMPNPAGKTEEESPRAPPSTVHPDHLRGQGGARGRDGDRGWAREMQSLPVNPGLDAPEAAGRSHMTGLQELAAAVPDRSSCPPYGSPRRNGTPGSTRHYHGSHEHHSSSDRPPSDSSSDDDTHTHTHAHPQHPRQTQ